MIDKRLEMASIVESAVSLRTTGRLARWREQPHRYPPALADRLIAAALSRWDPTCFLLDRVAFAVRRGGHWLARQLVWDVDQVMRILCALNHRRVPEPKWLDCLTGQLSVDPNDPTGRVGTIFMHSRPLTRVRVGLDLIDDALPLTRRLCLPMGSGRPYGRPCAVRPPAAESLLAQGQHRLGNPGARGQLRRMEPREL